MAENIEKIAMVMQEIDTEVERIKNAGVPAEKIHRRGDMTVWDRIEYLVDPGTFCPLHTFFDPDQEEPGSTSVFDGLARIPIIWFQDTTGIEVVDIAEKAAGASFAHRLVKEKDADWDLQPTIDKMNETINHCYDSSRPIFWARTGMVDEIIH